MRTFIYLFFFLFVASFVSCKKESPHYTISDGMKQFFVYQKGSYWIYKNDSTNSTDSTYVNNVIYSTQGIGDDGRHLYSFDLISLYFTSQILSNYIIGNICEETLPKLMIEDNNGFDIVAYIEGLIPNQKANTNCGSPSGDILYEEFPSITINSVTYSNIVHTTVATQNNSQKYSFYFAKNIGLIQYQYTENNTIQDSWSLKRYKVIQ